MLLGVVRESLLGHHIALAGRISPYHSVGQLGGLLTMRGQLLNTNRR
jgi:hypothetical protein